MVIIDLINGIFPGRFQVPVDNRSLTLVVSHRYCHVVIIYHHVVIVALLQPIVTQLLSHGHCQSSHRNRLSSHRYCLPSHGYCRVSIIAQCDLQGHRKLMPYTVLANSQWVVFTMRTNAKVMPYNDNYYSCHITVVKLV